MSAAWVAAAPSASAADPSPSPIQDRSTQDRSTSAQAATRADFSSNREPPAPGAGPAASTAIMGSLECTDRSLSGPHQVRTCSVAEVVLRLYLRTSSRLPTPAAPVPNRGPVGTRKPEEVERSSGFFFALTSSTRCSSTTWLSAVNRNDLPARLKGLPDPLPRISRTVSPGADARPGHPMRAKRPRRPPGHSGLFTACIIHASDGANAQQPLIY